MEEDTPTLLTRVSNWTGLTDLRIGAQEFYKGSYKRGAYHLVKGGLQAGVTAYMLGYLLPKIVNSCIYTVPQAGDVVKPTVGSSTKVLPGTVENMPVSHECPEAEVGLTILSAYDGKIAEYARPVIENQKAYAKANNYCYALYEGNLAAPRAPYWSKIVALEDQMKKVKDGHWLAWTDASAIFTNSKIKFEDVIRKYGDGKDVIVTSDPQVPINNAVFLVRNTAWSRKWLREVWSRSDLSVGGQGN